jgi:hypothetical protein
VCECVQGVCSGALLQGVVTALLQGVCAGRVSWRALLVLGNQLHAVRVLLTGGALY